LKKNEICFPNDEEFILLRAGDAGDWQDFKAASGISQPFSNLAPSVVDLIVLPDALNTVGSFV
jgi:hypothetical protein